jgi:hypothetical protein
MTLRTLQSILASAFGVGRVRPPDYNFIVRHDDLN